MRGLFFFDIADLVGAKHDRGWAKRHAGAGERQPSMPHNEASAHTKSE